MGTGGAPQSDQPVRRGQRVNALDGATRSQPVGRAGIGADGHLDEPPRSGEDRPYGDRNLVGRDQPRERTRVVVRQAREAVRDRFDADSDRDHDARLINAGIFNALDAIDAL